MMPDSRMRDAPNFLPRLCFVHIPKTAGTSVRSFLFSLYRELSFAAYTTSDYQVASDADLARCRFFAGHTYRRDWSRLPAGTLFFTVLRDPVERAVSLYRYWNTIDISHFEKQPDENRYVLEAISIARTQPIGDFIASEACLIMQQLRGAYANQFVSEEMVCCSMFGGPPAIAALDAAVDTLASFDAVLTTERLDLTFPRAVARFGLCGADARLPRENVSNMEVVYDRRELRELMLQVSPIDFEIYAVAQQLEDRYL